MARQNKEIIWRENMIKIKSITFNSHPILGNLHLDFTVRGNVADTIIFAGENGVGKTTVLKMLASLSGSDNKTLNYIYELELDKDGEYDKFQIIKDNRLNVLRFNSVKHGSFYYIDKNKIYSFKSIYSDVAINYNVPNITTATSLTLDEQFTTLRTSTNTAKDIAQLLIDIDTADGIDYKATMEAARRQGKDLNDVHIELRMNRFERAFNQMFTHIKWDGVKNIAGRKKVCFLSFGKEIELDNLSSGEKQVIFRGGHLLKNKNASEGAFVLIDEPEISLHPEWQKKIMNFYKNIFTDNNGKQFSQIFAVTHSPFIIHNKNRYNDKVIILKRNEQGEIVVDEQASYYDIGDTKLIEDAFNIYDFSKNSRSTVYVEGITDEQYLRNLAETFGIELNFEIKWIGERTDKEKDKNTGCTALDAASNVLSKMQQKNMLLYDCDTKKGDNNIGQLLIKTLKQYDNTQNIKVGIENALVLDSVDMKDFYTKHESIDDKGCKHINEELEKTKLCDYICTLDVERRKIIYTNLKIELDEIVGLLG